MGKLTAFAALIVLVVSITMAFVKPDLSGLQSFWDGLWQQVRDLVGLVGRMISAAIKEMGSNVNIAVDPLWIGVGVVAVVFLGWYLWKH